MRGKKMQNNSIKGKTVLVTGATKGMGFACSKAMLEQGANLVMVYHSDAERAEQVKSELSIYADHYFLLQADIAQPQERQRILDKTLLKFKNIDVLVNNAGIAATAGFLKETEEGFDKIIDVNLKAPIFLAQLVAKQMIDQGQGGSIINFSSVAAHRAFGGISYDAAKAGVLRATQTMANALGKYNIRVNSISPGMHNTEMNRAHWEHKTELYKSMVAVTALQRSAKADEMSGTVIYLASDQSSYVTGTDIIADGGFLSHCPGR
jgi:NAD(P)-dependent dehydrogenase (short-subunit alcohol dehydrogenase family)